MRKSSSDNQSLLSPSLDRVPNRLFSQRVNFTSPSIQLTTRFTVAVTFLTVMMFFTAMATTEATTPTPTPIPNAFIPTNSTGFFINLSQYFPVPFAPPRVLAAVPTNSVYASTSVGNLCIQLFPTNTPKTAANFLKYVNAGYYNNMLIQRSVPRFVIQTGSYKISNQDLANPQPIFSYGNIPSEARISNQTWTVAMALSTGSNSATGAWFINLTNNSSLLDNTSDGGPFTVFGHIVGTNSVATVNAIASLPTSDLTGISPLFQQFGFSTVPLNGLTNGQTTLYYSNLVMITNMATVPSATCDQTNAFSISLQGTNVVIKPLSPCTSPATVFINTLDTNGKLLSKNFQIANSKLNQTIKFPTGYTSYSTNAYNFTNFPTLSSGLALSSLTIQSGPGYATNGSLYFSGTGTVTLNASQTGDFFHNAVSTSGYIIVSKANQTITFPTIAAKSNIVLPYNVTFTTNFPTASSGLPVTLAVKSGPATLSGKMLSLSGNGTVTLTASQSGNTNYYSATPVTSSFMVSTKAP